MMTRQKNSTTNGATYDQGGSAQWSQICLLFYTLLFWMSGFTLIFLALWALLDPRRSYVLDLVDFSEDEPLLKAAVYMCIIVGVAILLVGFIACCGAIKKSRCMLTTFVIFVALIFCAECVIGALAISYRSKFLVSNFDVKLVRMMRDEYGIRLNNPRNNRITQLIDRLQFYEECCGSKNATNWEGSRWKKTSAASLGNSLLSNSAVAADFPDFSEERAYAALFSSVPVTCCVQLSGATPVNPVARSMARCQQPQATKWWRYQVQQCCGSSGPKDYADSYWFKTNTLRGTRSFVPASCCKQSQNARSNHIQPVDPMCTTYHYYSFAFNHSVNIQA